MIFRWSVWGARIKENVELLHYSTLSFIKQFGYSHKYIVYTDNSNLIAGCLNSHIDVQEFPKDGKSPFCVASKATWLKWCPVARLDINEDEVFVDSDVFLLKYPSEFETIISNPRIKFAVMDEYLGQPFQHGAMSRRATPDTPFINAGLFMQKAGFDISADLTSEFKWWERHVTCHEHTHHDEQGALAVALTKYHNRNEVCILPKEKYMIISETSNPGIKSLDGVTLFHATYPTHPAFYKFKHILDKILSAPKIISL